MDLGKLDQFFEMRILNPNRLSRLIKKSLIKIPLVVTNENYLIFLRNNSFAMICYNIDSDMFMRLQNEVINDSKKWLTL